LGGLLAGFELRWLPVGEPARRVVGPAGQHAREGEGGPVFGRFLGAPLIVFVALDALAGDLVGPGAVQAGGLERAVEVDHQVVLGGRPGDIFIPFDRKLVVAIDKVYLQPHDAPFGVHGEVSFVDRAIDEVIEVEPQPDAHAAFPAKGH
jgi:hypothetical protein